MVQLATKIEMNPVAAGWGDAQRVIDVLDVALEQGPVDSRRDILGRRYRDRLGTEFCRAAVQDDPVATVVRRLYRALHGAPGVPARGENRGGVRRTPYATGSTRDDAADRRPARSRRRRCQTRTGEGTGSCIPEGRPIRRAFPWRAAAIAATPRPELWAKAPSRRPRSAGPRRLRRPCQGASGTGDRSVRCILRAARAAS